MLIDHGLEGEAEFGDFAAVTRSGSPEDFVAEAEVAVLLLPVDLGGQGVDHAELAFLRLAEDDDLAGALMSRRPGATIWGTLSSTSTPLIYGMKVYWFNFEQRDFGRLAEVLGGLKGKFLMSLNDHKEVRRIFKGFRIQAVPTKYSSMNARQKGRNTQRRELLICNY